MTIATCHGRLVRTGTIPSLDSCLVLGYYTA